MRGSTGSWEAGETIPIRRPGNNNARQENSAGSGLFQTILLQEREYHKLFLFVNTFL